jgi:hypothetical protein
MLYFFTLATKFLFENARNAVVRCLQESFMQNKFTLMSRSVEKLRFCKRISMMETWPL